MAADDPGNRTELEDYLAVLSQPDEEGRPFIVVGGHAVNYWAKLYLPREPRLQAYLPFTSKDLDVIGSEAGARQVAETLGWKYSPPIVGGGSVQGVLTSPASDHPLTVEFLWEIKGVSHDSIREFVRENVIEPEGSGQQVRVRILDPMFLLHGKIRNAVDIEQNQRDKPRQDVKHVAMLALCVPHFLEDMCVQVADEATQKETFGNYIRAVNALKHNYSGRLFEARHPSQIHWQELIPQSVRQLTFDPQIQFLLRQFDGQEHSG